MSLTEKLHPSGFIISEGEGNISRDNGVLVSGQNLVAGTVLGKIANAIASAVKSGGNTGNGTNGSLTLSALAQGGVYKLRATAAGPGVAAAGTTGAVVGTGNGTITASPATGAGCKIGTYRVTCIAAAANSGTFSVEDPDGVTIGSAVVATPFTTHLTFTIADGSSDWVVGDHFPIVVAAANSGTFSVETPEGVFLPAATVGSAYTSDHINFTIADGSTDFIVGDGFDVTVGAGSGKFTILAPAAVDGSQVAAGILVAAVDASAADVACLNLARYAEVNTNELTWPGGITAGQKATATAQLLAAGIVIRA